MQYTRSISTAYELGEVDPSWHSANSPTDFSIRAEIRSHDEDGQLTYPILSALEDKLLPSDMSIDPIILDDLRVGIAAIDRLVRDYRGYSDDQATSILTSYRSGSGRNASLLGIPLNLIQAMTFLPVRFILPGPPHFDDRLFNRPPDDTTTADNVILSGSGRGTIVYEGPIHEVNTTRTGLFSELIGIFSSIGGPSRLSLRLQALGAYTTRVRDNTAVLINQRTLHKADFQLYRTSKPPVFLRAHITPTNPRQQEQHKDDKKTPRGEL